MPRLGPWLSPPSLTQMGTLLSHLHLAKQSWKSSKGSLLGNQGAWQRKGGKKRNGTGMETGCLLGTSLGPQWEESQAQEGPSLVGSGLQAWAPCDWGSAACPVASLDPYCSSPGFA